MNSAIKKFISCTLPCVLIYTQAVAQEALVSVDEIVEQEFTQTVPILGRLVAKQAGVVASRIDGAVARLLVQVGDELSQGEPIAVIDTEPLKLKQALAQTQKKEAQARINTARAQLALASQEVKRLSGLQSSAAVSKAALDDANQQKKIAFARVSEAEAALSSSNASLQVAELELRYATVLAIPANRLSGLSAGRKIDISFDDGSRHVASVRAIVPEENPNTRTRVVRFDVDLATIEGALAVEQSVTLHIPAGASRVIMSVHKDAIIRRGSGAIVYVVEDGAAKLRPITTGDAIGDRLEVLSGVSQGQQVVVRGNERLQPDQPVSIAGQDSAS